MKKQTIKLNESQLREMIQEALNELDPRTIARYADARQAQANGERSLSQSQVRRGMNQQQIQQQAQQGRQGAVDAWNRDFGWERPLKYGDYDNPNDEGYGKEYYKMALSNDGKQYSTQWKRDLSNGGGPTSKSNYFPKQDGGNQYYRARNGYEGWRPVRPEELGGGDKVAYQMQTGKLVNESKLRDIIKESVKKVLRELDMSYLTPEQLATDLCDGFPDKDYNDVLSRVYDVLNDGEYTIEDLWELNNEDSTKVYDIIYGFA